MRLTPGFGASPPVSPFLVHRIIAAILEGADHPGVLENDSIIRMARLCIATQEIALANDVETDFDSSVYRIAFLTSKAEGGSVRVEMLHGSGEVCRPLMPPAAKPNRGNDHAKSEAHFGLGQLRYVIRLYG
jgi:hypothetical protein